MGSRDKATDHVLVGGLRVGFRRAGDGPPLVLLHGGLGDSRAWRDQLEDLSDEFSVVAWDAPGCGGSADPPDNFRLADYADTLAGLIDALDLHRPHVLGHSFGAGLALELYRHNPELPRSLVLAGAYAGWAGSLSHEEVDKRLRLALEVAELLPDRFVPQAIPGLFSDLIPPERSEELAAIMSEVRPVGTRVMAHAFAEADCGTCWPRFRSPRCCCAVKPMSDRRYLSPRRSMPPSPCRRWWYCPASVTRATWRRLSSSTPRSEHSSGRSLILLRASDRVLGEGR